MAARKKEAEFCRCPNQAHSKVCNNVPTLICTTCQCMLCKGCADAHHPHKTLDKLEA